MKTIFLTECFFFPDLASSVPMKTLWFNLKLKFMMSMDDMVQFTLSLPAWAKHDYDS